MHSITITKEEFFQYLNIFKTEALEKLYRGLGSTVAEDFKIILWDFENKIIQGSFNLCDYQFEENSLVHVDFISREFFEINLNQTFFSDPDFFQLTLSREYKIKNGDALQIEMSHHALIVCISI